MRGLVKPDKLPDVIGIPRGAPDRCPQVPRTVARTPPGHVEPAMLGAAGRGPGVPARSRSVPKPGGCHYRSAGEHCDTGSFRTGFVSRQSDCGVTNTSTTSVSGRGGLLLPPTGRHPQLFPRGWPGGTMLSLAGPNVRRDSLLSPVALSGCGWNHGPDYSRARPRKI